jgi:hypothetical protein
MKLTSINKIASPSLARLSYDQDELPPLRLNRHGQRANEENKENGHPDFGSSLMRGWL